MNSNRLKNIHAKNFVGKHTKILWSCIPGDRICRNKLIIISQKCFDLAPIKMYFKSQFITFHKLLSFPLRRRKMCQYTSTCNTLTKKQGVCAYCQSSAASQQQLSKSKREKDVVGATAHVSHGGVVLLSQIPASASKHQWGFWMFVFFSPIISFITHFSFFKIPFNSFNINSVR